MTSDHNAAAVEVDGLHLDGMRYPINIRTGSGMALNGTANSASGVKLTSVQVAILDESDRTVQSAEAQTNASSFAFSSLDSQIRFGELANGTYTYMVVVTDSNGESLCFTTDFTVSDASNSTATYWSVQDTEGEKLSQEVQTAVTDAAQGTWNWLSHLFG